MDDLCIENISWWGMMHACSAFIQAREPCIRKAQAPRTSAQYSVPSC